MGQSLLELVTVQDEVRNKKVIQKLKTLPHGGGIGLQCSIKTETH